MKEHAIATRKKPSQMLADSAIAVPVEVSAALGGTESFKQTIQSEKQGHCQRKQPLSMT